MRALVTGLLLVLTPAAAAQEAPLPTRAELVERILDLSEIHSDDPSDQFWFLIDAAEPLTRPHLRDAADPLLARAELAIDAVAGDPAEVLDMSTNLAFMHTETGNHYALRSLVRRMEVAAEIYAAEPDGHDPRDVANAYEDIAGVYWDIGDADRFAEAYLTAARLYLDHGDTDSTLTALELVADLSGSPRPAEAQAMFAEINARLDPEDLDEFDLMDLEQARLRLLAWTDRENGPATALLATRRSGWDINERASFIGRLAVDAAYTSDHALALMYAREEARLLLMAPVEDTDNYALALLAQHAAEWGDCGLATQLADIARSPHANRQIALASTYAMSYAKRFKQVTSVSPIEELGDIIVVGCGGGRLSSTTSLIEAYLTCNQPRDALSTLTWDARDGVPIGRTPDQFHDALMRAQASGQAEILASLALSTLDEDAWSAILIRGANPQPSDEPISDYDASVAAEASVLARLAGDTRRADRLLRIALLYLDRRDITLDPYTLGIITAALPY